MSLSTIYERFLTSPNAGDLAEKASLHYVPTLNSFNTPASIIRHLESQTKSVVRLKAIRAISVVEGSSSIALETETTLEFLSGGGSYLPGLENFVTDKVATLPFTHIVSFDAGKIVQIRMSWDQAALLQQTDIIGSRGKNWPICDGKDQVHLIRTSRKNAASVSATPDTPPNRNQTTKEFPARSESPTKKHIRDPHKSLSLFEPTKIDEDADSCPPNLVSPRASAKPAPREMSELFAAGHEDLQPSAENGGSPKKIVDTKVIPSRGGPAQKFMPSRLFDDEPDNVQSPAPYKPNQSKYNHFDIGDHDENDPMQHRPKKASPGVSQAPPTRGRAGKAAAATWDFQDFVTPERVSQKVRGQDMIHFGIGDEQGANIQAQAKSVQPGKPRRDAEQHFELLDDGTPANRMPAQAKARRDAESHFDFDDQASPSEKRTIDPTKRVGLSSKQVLYQNNIYSSDDESGSEHKAPLNTITNNAGQRKGLGSHWDNTDESPANKKNDENKPMAADRAKAVKMMNANWTTYDKSPAHDRKPSTQGQRKGLGSHWGPGDEETPKPAKKKTENQASKSFWDF